jgi:hypothetical protein
MQGIADTKSISARIRGFQVAHGPCVAGGHHNDQLRSTVSLSLSHPPSSLSMTFAACIDPTFQLINYSLNQLSKNHVSKIPFHHSCSLSL